MAWRDMIQDISGQIPRLFEGIPIHRVPCLEMKYYRPAWLPIDELRQADLLHVNGLGAWLDFAIATKPLHRRPILLSTHGGIFHTARLGRLKDLYFNTWQRMNLRVVDRVFSSKFASIKYVSGVTEA